MHPRWHLPRVYHARVRPDGPDGRPDFPWRTALDAMRRGMILREGEKLAPVEARILPDKGPGVLLEMILRQGVNRQIRRMCRDLGLTVLRLRRVRQGPLELGNLPPGAARPLSPEETDSLRRAVED
jgi:23S rRNA pseudouridine2605 synthase